jgi:hypothetical protein
LQQNIQWWCESWCRNRHTPLINPYVWILMYRWCIVTRIWILSKSGTRWRLRCRCFMVSSWRSWTQINRLN